MATHAPFSIAHFDVAGPELARLAPFYAGLFGWAVNPRGPGYAQLATPAGGPGGALVEQPQAGITPGIVVPDLAAALAQAQALGGRVEMHETDKGCERKSQERDPEGNMQTLNAGD